MKKFLIIIPAYNEEKSICQVIANLAGFQPIADLVVVNDGSMDETESKVVGEHVYLINHPCNLGYGAALQTGYKFASMQNYSYVVQFDADGQHDPNDLKRIIAELEKGESDIVIGSRFLGGPSFRPSFLKKFAIASFRWIIMALTGTKITDPTSGLRGMNESVFRYYAIKDRLPSDFPDADIVIQMILQGYSVKEVPIGSKARLEGVSMHSGIKPFVYILKISISIFTILLRHRMIRWRKKHE